MLTPPTFSICMCNYNMADTLEKSLTSIASQLDDQFEIVVVDDGSSDNSVEVIEQMATKFPLIRLIKLTRDTSRQLGITRNISVENALGTYALLHLDCDDIYGPYIKDFCQSFLQIEQAIGKPFLLSGHHIQMARRDFLLSHGPYRNIFRGEDRDLWARLSLKDAYIPFDHIDFVVRLPKSTTEKLRRALTYTWNHIENDFRAGTSLLQFYKYEFQPFKRGSKLSRKMMAYRLIISIPAWLSAKCKSPIEELSNIRTADEMIDYRNRMRGALKSLVEKSGATVDWSTISIPGRKIFDI
jgi:glycosyltransferase involved in cell wall biosynthesis